MRLPVTTSEQRAEIYTDAKKLLHPGFLAHSMDLNGTRIVLRSLNEADWDMLKFRICNDTLVEWKRWSVAMSVWMVQGQLTVGSEDVLYRVYQMCQSLPLTILNDAYEVVNALLRRVRKAADCMKGFLYEDESRFLWKSEGFMLTSGRSFLPGMSMNPVQKIWIYYNQAEDESARDQADWDIAKFVVGPHAPKGIKKISAQDRKQQTDLKSRRQREMDRCYYEAQGILPKPGEAVTKSRFGDWKVHLAETPEELQEEMRRWVEGEKDDHDRVVDGVKTRIREEVEGRKLKAKVQQKALRRAMDEEGITHSRMIPMTGQAGQDFIDRVKKRMPGVSKVMQDATHNSAYDKYIKKDHEAGSLRVDGDGNIISATNVDPTQMVEMMRKPEPDEGPSLQEQIADRRPTLDLLNSEEDDS